ncbi:MAPK-activated protein kinase Srk1 [Podospora pseudopauciseta]|uniref:MAPK-activated protein kinase Srk1 n=1 Tax=Podospora pseudopauciseta TaxID=2093780 RepID=A0ABR0HX87_9PEZI|nr:MAPK-activated protein kinase Srk1 [Podospora pseudopauciseta]
MSTIQQLKNFIRHGKQARAANADDSARTKHEHSPPHSQAHAKQHNMAPAVSEPVYGAGAPRQNHVDAYSTAGDAQNRVAQAGHVAAHHVEPAQGVSSKTKKRVPDENIAKLVAEENADKNKLPRYQGLERWQLVEKMGDGAFKQQASPSGFQAKGSQSSREVQIMKQLDHPNIVKLIDFSESQHYYFIILELAPGGELFHQIVRLTYFSEELSRHVIVQVAKALEHLHEEKGIVHRDIKPENILFSPIPMVPSKHPKPKQPGDEDKVDEGEFIKGVGAGGIGQIKIADFGLSKIVWDNQTMTPCGTVGYTAPEIVKDERYSKSVDMWALGCVLYTMLCGFPPFYDESIEVLTEKVAKGQYTFLSPWWDDISKSAQDLISHLLCVDPEQRYTIKEFLAHPWIRESGPTPRDEKKSAMSSDGVLRAFDATKLVDGDKRYDFRSPAAVNLREVFDVGYAVHRQEEEGKRRKQIGGKAGVDRLAELDEDAEMEEAPAGSTQQIEQSMRNTQIKDHEQRGRDRSRKPHPPPAAAEQKGYGQHSATVAAAARQQVRERQRQKGVFELNLDGATLLGRRGAKPATRVA